jgi:nucleoside-diphosphate-sugar epimerase
VANELHVVIGGSGGTGAAVVDELVRRGRRVRSVSRTPLNARPGVEVLAADLADPAAAVEAVRGASVVYQCASPAYHRWSSEFPPIQANLIAAVETAGAKLVMADNLYMYGRSDGPLREDTPHRATDRKGLLRARMATDLLAAHDAGRIRVAIGRSSDYFGPGGVNSGVGELFFGAAAAGKQPRWLASLDQPHSLGYLPDMAAGLVTLGERDDADGHAWHLPAQPAMTGREWAARVSDALGRPLRLGRISRPMILAAGLVSPLLRELRGTLYQWEHPWVVDDSAFRTAFGAAPTPTDEAIEATIAWFRSRAAAVAA